MHCACVCCCARMQRAALLFVVVVVSLCARRGAGVWREVRPAGAADI